MTSTIICFFTLKFWIGTSRKGDEDRDWKHSTSSCRQKPLSRLIFKRRTDAANRELDVNQRWLTGQGHFRGQSDFNRGRCPSGPTPRSAPAHIQVSSYEPNKVSSRAHEINLNRRHSPRAKHMCARDNETDDTNTPPFQCTPGWSNDPRKWRGKTPYLYLRKTRSFYRQTRVMLVGTTGQLQPPPPKKRACCRAFFDSVLFHHRNLSLFATLNVTVIWCRKDCQIEAPRRTPLTGLCVHRLTVLKNTHPVRNLDFYAFHTLWRTI